MNYSTPQMSPANQGGYASSGNSGGSAQMPSAEPPAGAASSSTGCGCNGGAGAAGAAAGTPPPAMFSSADAGPSLQLGSEGAAAIGAWNNSKRVTALWVINQNRNSWMHVDGVGWKRLSTASESGIVALTRLSAHARERNSVVNYRDEADGMVHEIYVW